MVFGALERFTVVGYVGPFLCTLLVVWAARNLYFRLRSRGRSRHPRQAEATDESARSAAELPGYFEFEKPQRAHHDAAVIEQGEFYWK